MKRHSNTEIISILLHVAVLLFTMTGCSDIASDIVPEITAESGNPPVPTEIIDTVDPEVEQIVNPDRSLFDGESITVAVNFENLMQPFAAAYMRDNPGVTIEVVSYDEYWNRGNMHMAREEIATQLMAGSGPALMLGSLVNYLDPRSHNNFSDWLPIMRADPDFNEDDWFMNAFDAVSVKGRLLAFPTDFYYDIVTANRTIPGLPEVLSAKQSITFSELVDAHRSISLDAQYLFEPRNSFRATITMHYLHNFLDFETGMVDFDNERFIDLIANIRGIMDPDKQTFISNVVSPEEEAAISEEYSFIFSGFMDFQYFLDFDEALFIEPTPVVNDDGELMMYPLHSYLLNANATPTQQALAWDFIKFTMQPESYPPVLTQIGWQPTNKNLLRHIFENNLPFNIDYWFTKEFGWQLNGTMEDAVEGAIAMATSIGDMPMFNNTILPDEVSSMITEKLRDYQDGLLSAEQTAQNLQNQVELVLMEISAS